MEQNPLVLVSVGDLRKLVREECTVAIQSQSTSAAEEYLTVAEVTKRFRISKVTQWQMRRDGRLKAKKVGRKILFAASDVVAVLEPANRS